VPPGQRVYEVVPPGQRVYELVPPGQRVQEVVKAFANRPLCMFSFFPLSSRVLQTSRSNQRTMFRPAPLTMATVFKTLTEIAQTSGNAVSARPAMRPFSQPSSKHLLSLVLVGHALPRSAMGCGLGQSMQKKVDKIQNLLVACQGSEAKYLIRYAPDGAHDQAHGTKPDEGTGQTRRGHGTNTTRARDGGAQTPQAQRIGAREHVHGVRSIGWTDRCVTLRPRCVGHVGCWRASSASAWRNRPCWWRWRKPLCCTRSVRDARGRLRGAAATEAACLGGATQ